MYCFSIQHFTGNANSKTDSEKQNTLFDNATNFIGF